MNMLAKSCLRVLGFTGFFALAGCSEDTAPPSVPETEQETAPRDGVDGEPGADGKDGVDGAPGADGEDGVNGADGKDGKDGEPGVDGKDGVDGEPGVDGKDGVDGTNGLNGERGQDGARGDAGLDGQPGANGADGKTSLLRVLHELAGADCEFGGIRVEAGLDQNADGVLGDAEVGATPQFLCNAGPGWRELTALPAVTTAYSFTLGFTQSGEARLGFMFEDSAYRTQLLAQGDVLWDGGGVYSGNQVLGIYRLDGANAWKPYQGRLTPQFYRYSELEFDAEDSYYTTSFPSFGGLISVVKNGAAGAYALTPAFTDRRAHSIAFHGGELFALVAQRTPGLTLSTYPVAQLGSTLNNLWTNLVTLAPNASTVRDPDLLQAGGQLIAGYILEGKAVIRRTNQPSALTAEADFSVIGGCADAVELDLATDGTKLYRVCVRADGTTDLAVSADVAASEVSWAPLATAVVGPVTAVDLAATPSGAALAVRQGDALRVFRDSADPVPSFDAVIPGSFELGGASSTLILAVCDLAAGTHALRTFLP